MIILVNVCEDSKNKIIRFPQKKQSRPYRK